MEVGLDLHGVALVRVVELRNLEYGDNGRRMIEYGRTAKDTADSLDCNIDLNNLISSRSAILLISTITDQIGSSFRSKRKTIYLGTLVRVPTTVYCPK